MNKKSLLAGILLGIAVVVSLGIVYIDTIQNYWYVNGGFVKLIVSNQTQQAIMTVDTNTMRVGFNTNNITFSYAVKGRTPTNTATATGTSGSLPAGLRFDAGEGGSTTIPTTGLGGAGGSIGFQGGGGGEAISAITNYTGGAGGTALFSGGTGGGGTIGVASNNAVGGAGGTMTLQGGLPGVPTTPATNTVGGSGGSVSMTARGGGTPSAGWARKGGNGGVGTYTAGSGGSGTRTNSGAGGDMVMAAGNAGSVLTAPGDPGIAGNFNITAGNGGTGDTNGNGGGVYLRGGNPGSTALPGNVYLARNSTGSARGGVVIGLGEATITNVLSATATLDFPSIAAGTVADLPVTLAGSAPGDVVTLSVPLESVTNCMWMAFASNDVVYVRAANGQLVTAQDPNSGVFRVVNTKFQ